VPERGERLDIGVGERGKRQRDWRDGVRAQAAPPQHDVDERAPHATVSVGERVDGLELGVGHRGLRQRGQLVGVAEGDEVVEQPGTISGTGGTYSARHGLW
jgi:hypothetical protein